VNDPEMPPVYWLSGPSWTGKSTIARTVSERWFEGRLGASFFCSRLADNRSDPFSIFPSLAAQLALKYPEFRSALISWKNHKSLDDQMENLLVKPLVTSGISTVIVIDALDQCKDGRSILSSLKDFVSKIPKVKFFITSRPGEEIERGFDLMGEVQGTCAFH
jgi:hypothetical protein